MSNESYDLSEARTDKFRNDGYFSPNEFVVYVIIKGQDDSFGVAPELIIINHSIIWRLKAEVVSTVPGVCLPGSCHFHYQQNCCNLSCRAGCKLKGPIHDQSCCAKLRVVQHD
jgi:hypothetical protein